MAKGNKTNQSGNPENILKKFLGILNPKLGSASNIDLFESFQGFLPEVLFEIDINGNLTYLNNYGLKFLGKTVTELERGLNIAELFPDVQKRMFLDLKKIANPGDIVSYDYVFKGPEGFEIPAIFKTMGIFVDGKPTGYRGVVMNISKLKETENLLLKEKAFIRSFFDFSPEATAITKLDGTILQVNNEFVKLFGFSKKEANNSSIYDLIIPKEQINDTIHSINFTKEVQKIEKRTIRKDKSGNRLHIQMTASPVEVGGKTIAMVLMYRDISREVQHNMLQEILYKISSEALDLPNIKELYPIICGELDNLWFTENFFIALYNNETDTLSLPNFFDTSGEFKVVPVKNSLPGWVIRNKKPILLNGQDVIDFERLNFIDSGENKFETWMGVPLEVNNKLLGVIFVQEYENKSKYTQEDLNLLDYISKHIAIAIDRRLLIDKLKTTTQTAENAANSKQSFLSTMSHEIRTPLNEIIGIANILLQENPKPELTDYIRSLLFSSNHLLTLVNDVLDYSKIEAGKIEFENIQFNLREYLDDIKRSYTIRSNAKSISFELITDQNIPEFVVGDRVRLNQIVSNLFSNALKFTREGGIKIFVKELAVEDNTSTIEFRIQDTGIGISKDKIISIFESFTQATASTARQYGGTGLGLAISKKIVELSGGNITVNSVYGKGSTFIFTAQFKMPEKSLRPEKTNIPQKESILEGKRILIAEDNSINFMVANKILSNRGMIISHAENGKIAVEMVESQEFDLILMDLHMPEMDGIEATKMIRSSQNERVKTMPIVALTAVAMSDNKEQIDEVRFDGYILKPFKPDNLFKTISLLLESK